MITTNVSLLSSVFIWLGMYYGFKIKYRMVRNPVIITYGLLLTSELLDILANYNDNIRLIFIELLELLIILGFFATTYYSWERLEKISFKKKAVFRI